MTAAEIKTEAVIAIPGIELVTLQVDDGETYISKKFATIRGVIVKSNETAAAADALTATYATNTVTFSLAGTTTDVDCTVLIYGD